MIISRRVVVVRFAFFNVTLFLSACENMPPVGYTCMCVELQACNLVLGNDEYGERLVHTQAENTNSPP